MKRSISVEKCWKCGGSRADLEQKGQSLEKMAACILVGGSPETAVVLQVCSECLKDAGLKPIPEK